MAKDDAAPRRNIAGQITKLGRGTHDIRYDPVNDEIWTSNAYASALLVFRGGADGAEAPKRIIMGPKTQLDHVSRVDVDWVHNEVFAPEGGGVVVFPREAQGDVAPIRAIQGAKGYQISSLAVDPVHNLIVVGASTGRGRDQRVDLFIYNRTDNGNVQPRAVIRGPRTGQEVQIGGGQPLNQIQVYPPKGWVIVTLPGAYWSWESADYTPFIGVWSIHDNGDVPPRWKLGGPKSTLLRPRGVVLNPKNKELMVADMHLNAILTYYFPELF